LSAVRLGARSLTFGFIGLDERYHRQDRRSIHIADSATKIDARGPSWY
jgi:hypothetical protein